MDINVLTRVYCVLQQNGIVRDPKTAFLARVLPISENTVLLRSDPSDFFTFGLIELLVFSLTGQHIMRLDELHKQAICFLSSPNWEKGNWAVGVQSFFLGELPERPGDYIPSTLFRSYPCKRDWNASTLSNFDGAILNEFLNIAAALVNPSDLEELES